MACYAAVISLKHNIEHLIDPTVKSKVKASAYKKLEYLEGLLQRLDPQSNNQRFDTGAIEALGAEIRRAAWKLEDVLDAYALRHSLPPPGSKGSPEIPLVDNKGVQKEIRAFIRTVEKSGSELETLLDHPLAEEEEDDGDDEVVSSIPDFGRGSQSTKFAVPYYQFETKIEGLLFPLSENQLKAVTVYGMAGIGKSHFARDIYEHPEIVEYFNFRAWVKVGKKCRVENILIDILSQMEKKPRNLYLGEDVEALSSRLRLGLRDNRLCLIVLDDIWSQDLCKEIILRLKAADLVILTTRQVNVNSYFKNNVYHQMLFMNNEQSWDLLWRNVFVDESSFPAELEKVGREIAKNCEGLPLLILAVAEILRGSNKTEEYWNKVSNKKSATFVDAYDKILNVLFPSYEYLPEFLKALFLYMGVFPQSSEIFLYKLINLLTAEDFLEPDEYQTLEDYAKGCVYKLFANSIIMVRRMSYRKYIYKSWKLHSAYWYLCVKEARNRKFFHALSKLNECTQEFMEGHRRFSVQNNILFSIKEVRELMAAAASRIRSFLCTGEYHQYPVPVSLEMMLIKVLDALSLRFYEFPEEVVKLLLLRYLALTHNGKVPSSISNLQNLKLLIICQHHCVRLLRNPSFLPEEIWDMQQLAHLRITGSNLPDPSSRRKQPNLLKLYANADSCNKAVFRHIPNLQKLGITIELRPGNAENFDCFKHIRILYQLKSVKCVVVNPHLTSHSVAPPHHLSDFPRYLKKLSLNGLGYPWEYMTAIGSLPYLIVLKLRCSAFQGPKWETEAGEFTRLECLSLEDMDLAEWTTLKNYALPRLEHLTIQHCFNLKKIPFKTVGSEGKIKLVDCSPTLVAYLRHHSPPVVVTSSWNL